MLLEAAPTGDLKVELLIKIDGLVKSRKSPFSVIPAKAGIQSFQPVKEELDSGFHRSDDFLRDYQNWDLIEKYMKLNYIFHKILFGESNLIFRRHLFELSQGKDGAILTYILIPDVAPAADADPTLHAHL
jgi:hypothetical protein